MHRGAFRILSGWVQANTGPGGGMMLIIVFYSKQTDMTWHKNTTTGVLVLVWIPCT